MIALPIAVEPKVTTKPNSKSPSAVRGELSAKIRWRRSAGIEPQQPADQEQRGQNSDRKVDREQAE